jgi:histidine ammonia-lyase
MLLLARQRVGGADVVSVTHGNTEVALDTAIMDKLAKEWADSQEEKCAPSVATPVVVTARFSLTETRAILLARLVSLLQGRSLVRPDVLRWLAEALNRRVLPVLPADATDEGIVIKR